MENNNPQNISSKNKEDAIELLKKLGYVWFFRIKKSLNGTFFGYSELIFFFSSTRKVFSRYENFSENCSSIIESMAWLSKIKRPSLVKSDFIFLIYSLKLNLVLSSIVESFANEQIMSNFLFVWNSSNDEDKNAALVILGVIVVFSPYLSLDL